MIDDHYYCISMSLFVSIGGPFVSKPLKRHFGQQFLQRFDYCLWIWFACPKLVMCLQLAALLTHIPLDLKL